MILSIWICLALVDLIQADDATPKPPSSNANTASYFAAIKMVSDKYVTFYCGSAIISSKFLLTSAHCLQQYPKFKNAFEQHNMIPDKVIIRRAGEKLVYKIKKIIFNESYVKVCTIKNTYFHNIALVGLEKSINFKHNPQIQPIAIANVKTDNLDQSDRIEVSIFDKSVGSIPALVELTNQTEAKRKLAEHYFRCSRTLFVPTQMISAKSVDKSLKSNKTTCHNIEGSPAVYQEKGSDIKQLTGIASFWLPCLDAPIQAKAMVFTRVSFYYDWILKNIAKIDKAEERFVRIRSSFGGVGQHLDEALDALDESFSNDIAIISDPPKYQIPKKKLKLRQKA